jgi:hypothetical protein
MTLTKATFSMIEGAYLNILDFGADSTGVSDSTNAFASAIAALPATGGVINVPSGTYITETITLPGWPKSVHLVGEGRETTILQAKNANEAIIEGFGSVTPNFGTSFHYIYGFAFKAHASGSTGAALDLRFFSFSEIDNITFKANGSGKFAYGLLFDAGNLPSTYGHCYSNTVNDVAIVNETPVSYSVAQFRNHANQHYLTNWRIVAYDEAVCIEVEDQAPPNECRSIFIQNCYFEGLRSTVNGVISPGQGYVFVNSCYFEDVVSAFDTTVSGFISAMSSWFAPSPGTAYPAAYPLTWVSLGNFNENQQFQNILRNRFFTETILAGVADTNPDNAYLNIFGFNQTTAAFHTGLTTAVNQLVLRNPNGVVGTIQTNGSLTSYNTSSDYRLKQNIKPMKNALATIRKLNPVTYDWKTDGSAGHGFIAHELQEVIPLAVTGKKDATAENGEPIYQGMDASYLVATLTKAVQELAAEMETLKAR